MSSLTFNNQYRLEPYSAPSTPKVSLPVKPVDQIKDVAKPGQQDFATQLKQPTHDKSFLEEAKEALVYQRLGVDKEKIDEIKAQIEELAEQMQQQGADIETLQAKMQELQSMLEQEYQKGRERLEQKPEHEKGKIISAFV
ncbi:MULTISPECIES: hypothetical protein [unclassified Pseudoalteromonas]|uniref:hypothetical protein n=1 Tax=unclassified Pseudoalteromonas TaxID=194690 RepID=UPI000B3D304F|nr:MULTISPECIES: hypothetical protein [unclassified Pseudoalteromonas]MDN3377393.1 hypothetical protein [Pseudoalteromonas sp. APC 3893]MDN3385440.1 hypothetical protein [Pseudoalteromonas sp. APC 4017]OUS72381.1 hypothetical protein B5G52_08860 [Pseudoalteromonas sp. A601]